MGVALKKKKERKKKKKIGKSLQQVVLGKLDSYMKINEVRTHPHTMHKNKLKMSLRHDTIKLLEGSKGKTFSDLKLDQCFLRSVSQGQRNKTKNKQMGFKLTSFGIAKETIKKKKKTTYEMGENI